MNSSLSDYKEAINHSSDDFIISKKELYITAQHKDFEGRFGGKLNDDTIISLLELHNAVNVIKAGLIDTKKVKYYSHYTGLDALYSLLGKKSKFRLYSTASMNDPDEGKILVNELVPELKDFYNEDTHVYSDKHYAYVSSFVEEMTADVEKENNKALLHWRNYGHDTKGAKLVFPEKVFDKDYSGYLANPLPGESKDTESKNIKDSKKPKDKSTTRNLQERKKPPLLYKMEYIDVTDKSHKEEI